MRKTTSFSGPSFCFIMMITIKRDKPTRIFIDGWIFTLGPFLWFGVQSVSESVVGIVLKGHPSRGVPLGMLFSKTLHSICSQLQGLTFPQLNDQDVWKRKMARVKGGGKEGRKEEIELLFFLFVCLHLYLNPVELIIMFCHTILAYDQYLYHLYGQSLFNLVYIIM